MNTYPNTPAPWSIGSNGASVKVIDADGKAVCMLTPRKGAWNGDLIAAAPDLLTALQSTLRCLAWHEEQHGVGMDAKAIADARAAIAKATGETL
jgi:hypothetical protein